MAVELVVSLSAPGDRTQPWIDALLWSVAKEDTKLLESQRFVGGSDLRVWLKAIVAEHGRGKISVRWTDKLAENFALSHLIAICLDVPVPVPGVHSQRTAQAWPMTEEPKSDDPKRPSAALKAEGGR